MEDPVTERRCQPRLACEDLQSPQLTLRPVCPVELIDLSQHGLQLQTTRQLRPGTRVLVRLAIADRQTAMAAVVLRCVVWSLQLEEGVAYRAGLRFDAICLPFWEEHGRPLRNAPP